MVKNSKLAITEKAWQRQVIELAQLLGWKVYHTWNSIHSAKGFPDLVLVRERVIFAELKSEKGRVSDEQRQWIDALHQAAKVEVYCWKPSDFDEALRVLRRSVA